MFGINNPPQDDPDSITAQLEQALENAERNLKIAEAIAFIDSLTSDEPVHDESRIDLSSPKNWHQAVDLIRHVAETGNRNEANAISKVLRDALDSHPEIHRCSGASWCLALISMLERAVMTFSQMPGPPRN